MTSTALNVTRPGGGKVHLAASNGLPYCSPNGRVTSRGVMGYERTDRPVDCLRCSKVDQGGADAETCETYQRAIGRRASANLRARRQAKIAAAEVANAPGESFDPYWVRNLVERVGRELHDLDVLAADRDYDGANHPWSAGHCEGFKRAAEYLTSAVKQSAERLGLTEVLAAARAGATPVELAAIPQNQEG